MSAAAPPWVVTATIAPVSISTAFSALYANAVRPSFVITAQQTSAIVVSYYWHFVDIVWVGVFLSIFVVR